MAARRFLISGRVQGVGYRYFAERSAQETGVTGWARNLDDGRVEVIACGAVHALDRLEAALGEGPRLSRVSRVDVEALAAPPSPADLGVCEVEF